MDQLMATDSNHFSLPRRQPHSLSRNEVVNIDDVLTVIASGKTCLFSIPPQVRVCVCVLCVCVCVCVCVLGQCVHFSWFAALGYSLVPNSRN